MKPTRQETVRRYGLLGLGLLITAFGIAFSIQAGLGTSPISSLPYVVSLLTPLSVGTATICLHGVLILLQLLILRRRYDPVQLLQLPVALVFGYLTDLGVWVIQGIPVPSYGVRWLLCLAGVFLGVSLGATAQILGLYTKDAAIIAEGCVYFKIIAFSFAPMGLSTVLSAWLRCRGHANIPFAASIGAVLSNVVLNYVLIFGKLGLPACGVRGAAIATLVSQLVNLALIATGFLHCLRQDGERVQPSLHFTKITRRDYLGMITPILVSQFLWSLGQNVDSWARRIWRPTR